jgi:zinc/manganese transport system ATP-binding protein
MNVIAFRDVELKLRERTILSGISFDIAAREFVVVLGPNGSGKTTLLRAVLGLVPPSLGSIRVFGQEAKRGHPKIGYMPQIRSIAPGLRLNGWDFVASVVNGHRLGLPVLGKRGRSEVERALDLVHARTLAKRPVQELSGGEQQRLLFAQVLIGRPLLLDEPLINLDPRYQREVIDLVKSLQTDLGMTVLFCAHEINPLLPVLDRVLYLGSGQAALGTVDEVITGPVLSRLYGSNIEVVRLKGRVFVLSEGHVLEQDAHRHDVMVQE